MSGNLSSDFDRWMAQANAALVAGRGAEALQLIDRALSLRPHDADALNLRGNISGSLGRFDEAIRAFERAIALRPTVAELQYNVGYSLQCQGRFGEALVAYDRALGLRGAYPEALNNRGLVLHALGRREDAVVSFDAALRLRPGFAQALSNRGNALRELGLLEAAIASFDHAIACDARYTEALNNRGIAYGEEGRFDEALADYARAIELDPGYGEAHFNQGVTRLLLGDFEQGLKGYEWRYEGTYGSAPRPGGLLDWTGDPVDGNSVLLWGEQGLGDTIQFSRYAGLVRDRGASVILEVQPQLKALLSSLAGVRVIANGEPRPAFDCQRALLSLPFVLGTRLDTIVADVPYLRAEPERARQWGARLRSVPGGLRVGIAWQGKAGVTIDAGRSPPLASYHLLSQVAGVRLIRLQKESGLEQLSNLPAGMTVETLGAFDEDQDAFLDTAAIMSHLDLVITSDTAVAHLAGALGRPVWCALKAVPDWRWMLDRLDSPWYPTMRLFRQKTRNDWVGVFAAMTSELEAMARGKAAP